MSKIIEKFPVGAIATTVGAVTLANVYSLLKFNYLRNIFMLIGIIVLVIATLKLVVFKKVFLEEYKNTVPASLYGTYSMLMMIIGAYLFDFSPIIGKALWLFAVFFHAVLIIVFTYRNVIKNFNIDGFVPSWFVTYNGIMVSIVVGGQMNEPLISKIVLGYGIAVFFIIIPFMIKRLLVKPLPDMLYHTKAVLLAPSSLCIVGYLNVIKEPNLTVAFVLYGIVFVTLVSVVMSIPKFFSFDFHPGFAGTTFPMAIGTVATFKMGSYLSGLGMNGIGEALRNVGGIQLFITTSIIAFVFSNFIQHLKKIK
ncbi:TDT family transporter [Cetobacterium sp. 8H]|uniref:TDT family transporter n=1 Tax=Cetobacterium sp. 8H TaxID=2759681 RepID=UPI00163BB859|nr:TDT family transporter [Cetobacterium sp. 8H]MBC2850400.1 TDT family transporter [Cetobacterium sp. 8H]